MEKTGRQSFDTAVFLPLFFFLLFIGCKKDSLSDATFKQINSPVTTRQSADQTSLLIGTWYLTTLLKEDGTNILLSECDKKESVTYKSDGTCIHRSYAVEQGICELTNMYSCTYTFEFDIITSTSASGTWKSIVKFPDAKTLEVYNNLAERIAVYVKPR